MLNMIEKYMEEIWKRYVFRTKTENYWWCKINMIIYNNGISKNNRLVRNKQNEPAKFRTRNWGEINNELRGTYKPSNQGKLEISTIR